MRDSIKGLGKINIHIDWAWGQKLRWVR